MPAEKEPTVEAESIESAQPERQFFKCPIPAEQSAAVLCFSRMKIPAELQESSIDGFSVLVQQQHAGQLRLGPRWVLQSVNERSEVYPQWLYCAPDGRVQIGLRRLQDLTPKARWFPRLGRSRPREIDHSLLFVSLVLLILLAISLPGIGDLLGTAPWIERTVKEFLGGSLGRVSRGG
jgi:hypothetical protein